MWAQPRLSMASMMKSRRLRFDARPTQKMPRLQMSPTWTGVVVICETAHVALGTPFARFSDCPPYRFHVQAGGHVLGLPLAGPRPAPPPRSALPSGSVGRIRGAL